MLGPFFWAKLAGHSTPQSQKIADALNASVFFD
jgi:hypothetical protein